MIFSHLWMIDHFCRGIITAHFVLVIGSSHQLDTVRTACNFLHSFEKIRKTADHNKKIKMQRIGCWSWRARSVIRNLVAFWSFFYILISFISPQNLLLPSSFTKVTAEIQLVFKIPTSSWHDFRAVSSVRDNFRRRFSGCWRFCDHYHVVAI